VGKSVGLHPVWLLLALSAFGSAFGFVGMLVAVPVAAMFGVFTRFAVEQYQSSLLYRGIAGKQGDRPAPPDDTSDATPEDTPDDRQGVQVQPPAQTAAKSAARRSRKAAGGGKA
jgi:hypothetical protein